MRRGGAASLAFLAAAGLVAVATYRGGRGPDATAYATFTARIMASPISVTAPAPVAAEAADLVFGVFREVDRAMSEWEQSSSLSAVNRAAGRHPVEVPGPLRALVRRGLDIGRRTDGAFDITWAALWGLWDFRAETPVVPGDDEIARRVDLVDFRRVAVDDRAGTVYLPEAGMLIGLGGIAKGHALDRAAETLRARGFDSFLISAAGQLVLGGRRGDRAWRVGVRAPRGAPHEYFASLELTDVSVSTSGDYERYFERDGVRYHHVLDPRTGRPSRGVRSATVVGADATLVDALSTAVMVMGVERGLAMVESWEGVEALVVDDAGREHVTSGLVGRLRRPAGVPADP